jgi:hypothetical protein
MSQISEFEVQQAGLVTLSESEMENLNGGCGEMDGGCPPADEQPPY